MTFDIIPRERVKMEKQPRTEAWETALEAEKRKKLTSTAS